MALQCGLQQTQKQSRLYHASEVHLHLPPFIIFYLKLMSSEESPPAEKKNYDDISFQRRRQLIDLIVVDKKTIRAAAQKLNIKHSTAKHIIGLFRKQGKIVKKKPRKLICTHSDHQHHHQKSSSESSPQFIFVPYPVIMVYPGQASLMPINLEHSLV